MLCRAEKVFGSACARPFTCLIALSRQGWRESDFEKLLPAATGILFPVGPIDVTKSADSTSSWTWDPLQFAVLRRGFRAHLVQRGSLGQWDFLHAQARSAILRQYLADPEMTRRLHQVTADHLLSLTDDDPLWLHETMFHLIEADDKKNAARFYAGLSNFNEEANEATRILVQGLMSSSEGETNPRRDWIVAVIDQEDLDNDTVWQLCNRIQCNLNDFLENKAGLDIRRSLLEGSQTELKRLVVLDPSNEVWQRDLSRSHIKIGDVLRDQEDLSGALNAYHESLDILERLVVSDPSNENCQVELAYTYVKIGDVPHTQEDWTGALKAYRESLSVFKRMAVSDPSNDCWLRELTLIHNNIGAILRDQGDLTGAIESYREPIAFLERLAATDPSDAAWQRNLSSLFYKMAEIKERSGQGDSKTWWRKAYETLSSANNRGTILPGDDRLLLFLKDKV